MDSSREATSGIGRARVLGPLPEPGRSHRAAAAVIMMSAGLFIAIPLSAVLPTGADFTALTMRGGSLTGFVVLSLCTSDAGSGDHVARRNRHLHRAVGVSRLFYGCSVLPDRAIRHANTLHRDLHDHASRLPGRRLVCLDSTQQSRMVTCRRVQPISLDRTGGFRDSVCCSTRPLLRDHPA